MAYKTRLEGLRSRIPHYLCPGCATIFTKRKPASCTVCGAKKFLHFPSKKEYMRFVEICFMERAGNIADIKLHPRFEVTLAGEKVIIELDFSYFDKATGETVYEDVKSRGSDTGISKLKRLLVEHFHGVKVVLV